MTKRSARPVTRETSTRARAPRIAAVAATGWRVSTADLPPYIRALVDEEHELYGIYQVQKPEPQSEDACILIETCLRAAATATSLRELRAVLATTYERVEAFNDAIRASHPDPDEREKRCALGYATLAKATVGGYLVAFIGWGHIMMLRRGRLKLLNVPHMKRGSNGSSYHLSEGFGLPRPKYDALRVDVEPGDRLLLTTRASVMPESDIREQLSGKKPAEELAESLAAVVVLEHPCPAPKAVGGRTGSVTWAALSSVGLRADNQDAVLVDEELGLFAIADGMGGHAGGAVAARTAIDAVPEVLKAEGSPKAWEATLGRAFDVASSRVIRATEEGGSTLLVALLRGRTLGLAHLGDSRAYLLHDGALRQLTMDHTWVAQEVRAGRMTAEAAKTDSRRNVLANAIGRGVKAPPDMMSVDLEEGDQILLCTDGLTGPVPDDAIAKALMTAGTAAEAVDELVALAFAGDAPDNVTILVLRCESEASPVPPRPARPPARRRR